ncbi:Dihydrofolate reductase [Heliothis virescens] [Rhizoctonia solani]|uniref:Dihydrofolate reductase n=1 Tax=Rhizoctonia solani TaxID=456999 RepID=A0A0K6G5K9_9AGAM|nr:Dihydrofolate reductase [Heliothis virescens] [Rhizoctonia solani]
MLRSHKSSRSRKQTGRNRSISLHTPRQQTSHDYYRSKRQETSRDILTMPSPLPQLTLVVAATLTNGIGAKGSLPWRLPREMAYFAKVTREGGPRSSGPNAVIMGRKTWESIKPQYRPLKGRLNVVISSSIASVDDLAPASASEHPTLLATSLEASVAGVEASNAFIIGGASIYTQALEHPATTRILLTRILEPAYEECDVFFPEI